MLIVSNIKEEGIINLDNIIHLHVKGLRENGKTYYSLMYICVDVRPGFIGQWETKDKAQAALDEIIKAHHMGNKEVYLRD